MNQVILDVISTVLVAVITGAVSIGVAWFQKQCKSERISDAVARLGDAAVVVAGELQQTVVEKWKEQGGGKLTKEQVAQLGQLSLQTVKRVMDEPAMNLLYSVGVDVDELIKANVEKAVNGLKGSAFGDGMDG